MSVMELTRRCQWLAVRFGANSDPIQYAPLVIPGRMHAIRRMVEAAVLLQ